MCSGSFIAAFLMSLISSAPTAPVRHCQVPCGIYGDKMRVDMILEDVATIEKGMTTINELEAKDGQNRNQLVRWVMTKDQHAQHIQDVVSSYWLTQRIKAPPTDDVASWKKYTDQLQAMHRILTDAMKCKQTVDTAHCKSLREALGQFTRMYFTAEDLKHLEHHKGPGEQEKSGKDHDHGEKK